jgi:hypothetical protein
VTRYCAASRLRANLRHLDLVRAAVDLQHLGVAAELLDAKLRHVTVAAEELHGLERDLHGCLRRIQLAGRGLGEAHRLASFTHLDLAEDEVLEVHAGDLHLRELQLDQLELPDRLAELDARAGVVETQCEALLDDAEGHGGDAGALHRERRLGARAALR